MGGSSSKQQLDDEQPSNQEQLDLPIEKTLGEDIIAVHHLEKRYTLQGMDETVTALVDLHLSPGSEFYPVRRGEFLMLRGPSGGGKTSFLNVLGTIDRASAGHIELLGKRIDEKCTDQDLSRLRLEYIGFVFQSFNLIATMSAFENVELPMTILGKLTKAQRKKRAQELLDLVHLQDRGNHVPAELSGGEQQRVSIARALANEPQILLLDEPTGDLDTRNTVDVMDLLLRINMVNKTTMVMVTHNPDIECYADRILYVEDGRFRMQALNLQQTALDFELYQEHLAAQV